MSCYWIYVGFDVVDINEDGPDDMEGLDVAAAHVANLLSNEPADSKLSFQTCIFIPLHQSVITELVRRMINMTIIISTSCCTVHYCSLIVKVQI
jgi:hypothetical protein